MLVAFVVLLAAMQALFCAGALLYCLLAVLRWRAASPGEQERALMRPLPWRILDFGSARR